jgi:GT2 family glycosyltransferase
VFSTIEKDLKQFDDPTEIFWATGAALFVNAKAFREVGGLDDAYFAHMEEIDLCWRLKNVGYKIFVQPQSVVYHIGGGTLNKFSSQKTYLNFRNNLSTLTKNHPGGTLFPKILYRMILDGVAAFRFLLAGTPSHFFAVIRAHFAFYFRLPDILKKRRTMKKVPGFKFSKSLVYKGNIVYDYFLGKKHTFKELTSGFFD